MLFERPWGLVVVIALAAAGVRAADPVDLVDPMYGVAAGRGTCIPGPCLPNGSIHPSPDTLKPSPNGYVRTEPIVGFSQLHCQGTGGVPSYGNFLLTPLLGMATDDAGRASPKAQESATCTSYRVQLTRHDIACEIIPARHSALYRFTFPASDDARLTLDAARKIGKPSAITGDVDIHIDPATGTITGGGHYGGNWSSGPYTLYFCACTSEKPTGHGVWNKDVVSDGVATASATVQGRLGAYLRFDTRTQHTVNLKLAVSFTSVAQARSYLEQEIPAWDAAALQAAARVQWQKALSLVQIDAAAATEPRRFYSALYHTQIHPRDRTGDMPGFAAGTPVWDDQYTLWDSWKTQYPLQAIIRPDLVRDNINCFLTRFAHSGFAATAFINGTEGRVGQGGDEVDNVVADAYAKGIPGVDWQAAYAMLRSDAETRRTPYYREHGWVPVEVKGEHEDTGRMHSGSGTAAMAYDDFCVSQVAAGLGKTADAQRYAARAANWRNVWDKSLEDGGFTGFLSGRHKDGRFSGKAPTALNDYYEGNAWIYSYTVVHDVPGMVELMGGKDKFIARLLFALGHNRIDFTNEPSFQTVWLFDLVGRPYLASYGADLLRRQYDDAGCPGDEDDGAMSSLYVFLDAGFFPFAGTDAYYLHGPRVGQMVFALPGGKTFTVLGRNAGDGQPYIQSVTLNGKPLDVPVIHHRDIVAGGTLEFVMGAKPSAWGCGGDFDTARAARETETK